MITASRTRLWIALALLLLPMLGGVLSGQAGAVQATTSVRIAFWGDPAEETAYERVAGVHALSVPPRAAHPRSVRAGKSLTKRSSSPACRDRVVVDHRPGAPTLDPWRSCCGWCRPVS